MSSPVFDQVGICDFCLSDERPVARFNYEDGMECCESCYRAMEEEEHAA